MTQAASTPDVALARASRVNRKVLSLGLAVAIPLMAVLLLNLGRDPRSVRSPLIGRPAPAFSLAPVGGGAPVTLESLRGRPVVVNFWATWPDTVPGDARLAAAVRRVRSLVYGWPDDLPPTDGSSSS